MMIQMPRIAGKPRVAAARSTKAKSAAASNAGAAAAAAPEAIAPTFEGAGVNATQHGPLYYTTLGKVSFHTRDYMKGRTDTVRASFPNALGIDDFMNRVEMALFSNGFSGENSIAMSNLCRDEVCIALKDKIDSVFGWSFNTVGIGGVLTCGVTGLKAGLSHSPMDANASQKERYVFFSLPHIAIDSKGTLGAISRPGRPGESAACGALVKIMGYFKEAGVDNALKPEMVFDEDDIEVSLLRTRLAKRIKSNNIDPFRLNIVQLTDICERVLASDLEDLIAQAVDPKKADYAVITGVQIHNWITEDEPNGAPNLEFVQPVSVYAVVDGVKKQIDLTSIPSMTPRQTRILAKEDVSRRGWN